ncbi:uncharacterized protein BO95DRAFT_468978 [Aspergillus brunneoviolaceus CBS 621.78]|uniref:Uncharacterized protein n=1 Tax=Aspergillus brunneoviolaceus CBS 621.78 TaxID=1450534 RepID=A0ACD1FT90_9EURO|nr:hypothetical protein BO95DRAFT_468978 [Aspergillus brunneoviolaceus CBS 621.78]RAH40205.1 hypothetical protein BO95DRAFT_468978 [Aspergillus brunneoviolaceus CBS 621.78]
MEHLGYPEARKAQNRIVILTSTQFYATQILQATERTAKVQIPTLFRKKNLHHVEGKGECGVVYARVIRDEFHLDKGKGTGVTQYMQDLEALEPLRRQPEFRWIPAATSACVAFIMVRYPVRGGDPFDKLPSSSVCTLSRASLTLGTAATSLGSSRRVRLPPVSSENVDRIRHNSQGLVDAPKNDHEAASHPSNHYRHTYGHHRRPRCHPESQIYLHFVWAIAQEQMDTRMGYRSATRDRFGRIQRENHTIHVHEGVNEMVMSPPMADLVLPSQSSYE